MLISTVHEHIVHSQSTGVLHFFHSNFHCYTQVTSRSEQLLQVKDLKEEVLHQFEELIEKKSKVSHSDSHMTLYYSTLSVQQSICDSVCVHGWCVSQEHGCHFLQTSTSAMLV